MTLNDRIFISRTSADREAAQWMALTLEDAGYTCVIQDRDFRIGTSFPANMREGFESCDTTIAVMSPDYWTSPFCRDEWDAAYALDRGGQGRLIPVMVRACTVPKLAAKLAYLDLSKPVEADKARALGQAVDGVIRGGASLPDALEPSDDVIANASFFTPHFTGREAELAALHEALWSGQVAAVTPPAAVTGMGGAGKSALAKEYALRHGPRYAGVWLVRAEQDATLHADLAALAARLDRRLEGAADIEAAARAGAELAARLAGQQGRPFLILLDNVETPKGIPDWLRKAGLHLVASSRYTTWPGWAQAVEVTKLPAAAARALLLETCGRGEGPGLDGLLLELDGLPLALVQAGAYLRENPSEGFGDYAAALAARIGAAPDDWPADQKLVAATFGPSLERAEAAAPGARQMLALASFFAPEDIGLELVKIEDEIGEASRRAADALARYSLWRRKAEESPHGATYSVHRLLQAAVRGGIDEDSLTASAKVAAGALAARFSGHPGDVRTWPVNAPLVPHAVALSAATPDHAAGADLAIALNQAGLFFQRRAENLAAEPLFRRALAIDEASYGPEHPEVAIRLNNLASVLKATNRLAEAEPLMRRALAIDEARYGPEHPEVAIRLNNLASLLQDTNRLSEAEPMMRRALSIDEASFGPEQPNVANRLNNLASLLQETNRPQEAEPLMQRALAIYEKSYDPEHPDVATVLNNLAQLLKATNRPHEAEPLYRRALAIDEANLGQEHPNVAISLNNLARLLQATDRPLEAEQLMRRALHIFEASLPAGHPNIEIVAENLRELEDALAAASSGGGTATAASLPSQESAAGEHVANAVGQWLGFLALMALGAGALWLGMADPFGWFGR